MQDVKYYFFRDLDNESNLIEGKTYHAAGYVDEMFCELDKPNENGKDLTVTFFNPFMGIVICAWRSLHEVELFEVDELEYMKLFGLYQCIS